MGFFTKYVAGEGTRKGVARDSVRGIEAENEIWNACLVPKEVWKEGEFIARTRTGGQARI